jgi:hypothetical protein
MISLKLEATKVMSKRTLPKNKTGGLNLNWAIGQALGELGLNAKIGDVRHYISEKYGALGKKAIQKNNSLSTGLSTMRKKMRDEKGKYPPVPAYTVEVVSGVSTDADRVGEYIKMKLRPAMDLVESVLKKTGYNFGDLQRAVAEIESAQKVFGQDLSGVVSLIK